MTNRIEKIAVFCGSSVGTQAIYQEAAISLAQSFYEHNIQLIYGGAKVGLMGIIADHLLSLGGYVIGIMPQSLIDVEIGHEGLSELYVVDSLYERKKLFEELADGFVLMPGGPGSLDEFFEVYTTAQLAYHHKPCGILNINGYYDNLLNFLTIAVRDGFLKTEQQAMLIVASTPLNLIQSFKQYQAPKQSKWPKTTINNEQAIA